MTYIIEANAGLIFFYGIYFLLLRNETDFRKQRFFLLTAAVCALVFPLIDIDLVSAAPVLGSGIVATTTFLPELLVGEGETGAISTADMLLAIHLLVAMTVAVPVIVQGMRMYRFVRRSAGSYFGNYYVIESKVDKPSWSFFRLIFIGQSDKLSPEEKDLIVRHEMLHGKLFHSVDTLLLTVLCMVFWFNPIAWVYRKTMARIHEFEVDAMVTEKGDSPNYGLLLAKTALSANGFLLTHYFNQSFILKRINMLNMLKRRISSWKLTVLATTVAVYFVAVACTELVSEESAIAADEIPSSVIEQFERIKRNNPGRTFALKEVTDHNGFYRLPHDTKVLAGMISSPETGRAWIVTEDIDPNTEVFGVVDETAAPKKGMTFFYSKINDVLNYPEQARRMGIEGKVFVEFVVMEDGHLTDFKVLKGIGGGCDAEAIRALTKMDSWKPGMLNGVAVRQKLVLPLTFKLN